MTGKAKRPVRAAKRNVKAPVTVGLLIRRVAMQLKKSGVVVAHGTTDPLAEAAFMVGETLGIGPDRIASAAKRRASVAVQAKVAALVGERIRIRKPAAYLLNKAYMLGVPFYVDERTIVPRSYLGELLDSDLFDGSLIADSSRVTRVLDLCTGSGCLAVLAAMRFPRAVVDAVDLSADALDVAKRNVSDHGLRNRIRLHRGNLFAPLAGERYDLIVSNPPYVDAGGMAALPPECRHEPAMAFDGGADGIALVRRILGEAGHHLTENGGLLCEVGRCAPALERACPRTPFLWLDSEESSGEVFWLAAAALKGSKRSR